MPVKKHYPEHIITFRKDKGFSLLVIYTYLPSYIEWLIQNLNHFCIDINAFEGNLELTWNID